jgi:hypothetical protein
MTTIEGRGVKTGRGEALLFYTCDVHYPNSEYGFNFNTSLTYTLTREREREQGD